jgi:leucyl aminopeptidase (aminopeptidase T)
MPVGRAVALEESPPGQLAEVMVRQQLQLKRDENLIIETWNHTLPFAAACVVEARRIGAHPMLWLEDEPAYFHSIQAASALSRMSRVGTHEWAAMERSETYLFFPGPADRSRLDALNPTQRRALTGYNDEWYRRAKKSRLRGVRCVLGYASESEAERLGVEASVWRSQLIDGTVHCDFPTLTRDARRVRSALLTGSELRITASNGTDFRVRLNRREPYVDDGVVGPDDLRLGRNMTIAPPGFVGGAVEARTAEGIAIANRPSFLNAGRVEGGQWEMQGGHLANHWYTEGQSIFDTAYERAPRGRDAVSFVSLGINSALAPGVPRVEDQEAGAVALGIGGNEFYGGSNRCPFVSYIIIGEATVAVDGKPLADRGKLL